MTNSYESLKLLELLECTPNLEVKIESAHLLGLFDYFMAKKNEQASTEKEEKLLTTEEACRMAKVSRPTLHRWKKAGLVPYIKIGKNVRYKQSDLIETLNKSRINGK